MTGVQTCALPILVFSSTIMKDTTKLLLHCVLTTRHLRMSYCYIPFELPRDSSRVGILSRIRLSWAVRARFSKCSPNLKCCDARLNNCTTLSILSRSVVIFTESKKIRVNSARCWFRVFSVRANLLVIRRLLFRRNEYTFRVFGNSSMQRAISGPPFANMNWFTLRDWA